MLLAAGMNTRRLLLLLCSLVGLTVLGVVACASTSSMDGDPRKDVGDPGAPLQEPVEGGVGAAPVSGLPCDVEKVLKERCQSCHQATPQYGAPNALVTYADMDTTGSGGKKMYEIVKERVHDDKRPMPQAPYPRLTTQELAVIDGWVAAGAKRSTDACKNDGDAGEAGVKPLSCKPDVTIRAPSKWTMPKDRRDVYACVGFDYQATEKRHIVALAAHVDNAKLLHHVLLMQSPVSISPTPYECGAVVSADWKYLTGWAPGGDNMELPPEAGFPAEKGVTHYVLQLHYNNAKGLEGETDASGYDFCTTKQLRQFDAGSLAFGGMAFSIPPRSDKKIKCDYVLPPQFNNVKLIQTWPHMHEMGRSMVTEHIPLGGGKTNTVVASTNYSFQDQRSFPANQDVGPGDVIRTHCAWKNTSDQTMTWGEGTGDEMCFNFTSYYPNIPDLFPVFTWITPSLTALCTDE